MVSRGATPLYHRIQDSNPFLDPCSERGVMETIPPPRLLAGCVVRELDLRETAGREERDVPTFPDEEPDRDSALGENDVLFIMKR
ncbi:hypothetical protein RRG08_032336 [Elysia crispata]|uniref:Uncharacterized protein n=1 Tax=Elysia crispata TaxID=231223 RepID=A0AAE1DRI7_9GAST|nr:hypothetical protein RRG08_032336 [Elysia crispata]